MANTRFNYDECRTAKILQESTGPGRYLLNTPGPGCNPCFITDPHIRLQGIGPNLRTVVLRDFNPKNLEFAIYSDIRSSKIKELKLFPEAQFLFYDSSRLIQLIIDLNLKKFFTAQCIYNNLPESSKRDYSSILMPGSEIKNPDEVQYNLKKNNFVKIVFEAKKIEYLKLKRPNHIRSIYSVKDNWEGKFLAP